MIVTDTNVIAYLLLPTPLTVKAERLFARDHDWIVPRLWRSELRSVLTLYIRKDLLDLEQACRLLEEAERMFTGKEYEVATRDVMMLAAKSGCSAYDCEFIALAYSFEVTLVTTDRQVLRAFPEIATSLDAAAG